MTSFISAQIHGNWVGYFLEVQPKKLTLMRFVVAPYIIQISKNTMFLLNFQDVLHFLIVSSYGKCSFYLHLLEQKSFFNSFFLSFVSNWIIHFLKIIKRCIFDCILFKWMCVCVQTIKNQIYIIALWTKYIINYFRWFFRHFCEICCYLHDVLYIFLSNWFIVINGIESM